MPTVRHSQRLPFPPADVFAFFLRPAHVVAAAPPGLWLRLVAGPGVRSAVGDRMTVEARRWGLTRRITTEVVELAAPGRLVEEQREGPLARWRLARTITEVEQGCEVVEEIDFDPPGGLLGLTLTAAVVQRDLDEAFTWRQEHLEGLIRSAQTASS